MTSTREGEAGSVQCARPVDALLGGDPVDRKLVFRIGVAWAGLARDRRLATVGVSLPRDALEPVDGFAFACEGRVAELVVEADAERFTRQVPGHWPLRTSVMTRVYGGALRTPVGRHAARPTARAHANGVHTASSVLHAGCRPRSMGVALCFGDGVP